MYIFVYSLKSQNNVEFLENISIFLNLGINETKQPKPFLKFIYFTFRVKKIQIKSFIKEEKLNRFIFSRLRHQHPKFNHTKI